MSMRINQNVSALLTYAAYSRNSTLLEKSMQRLSTGLRINSGGDDPAGLSMSQRLQVQLRGLQQATLNAQDGYSMAQVADGALDQVANSLQRMRELALQATSPVLADADRLVIQDEILQLQSEINSVANSTQFNTKSLLNGSQNSRVSSTSTSGTAYVSGSAIPLPGAYTISVSELRTGAEQVQRSAAFTTVSGGTAAGGSTELNSIAQLYDAASVFALAAPATLTLAGNGKTTQVTVQGTMTMSDVATTLQNAIVNDLGLAGSSVGVNGSTTANPGTLEIRSGQQGTQGEIAVLGPTTLMSSLALSTTTAAVDPVNQVTVTRNDGTATTAQTSGGTLAGVISGLTIQFDNITAAAVLGTQATSGVQVAASVTVSLADNKGNSVVIGLAAGSYSMNQVVSVFNGLMTGANIRGQASAVGNNLVFTSTDTGTAGFISITNVTAGNPLGLSTGRYAGSGGTNASHSGFNTVLSFNFGVASVMSVIDSHGNDTRISLTGNYGSVNGLITSINNTLIADNSSVRAINNAGTLQFQTVDTGAAAGFTVNLSAIASTNLRMNGNVVSGTGGSAANQTFSTDPTRVLAGFSVYDAGANPVLFAVSDNFGNTQNVSINTGNGAGSIFVTGSAVVSLINGALTQVQAAANFTSDQRIRIAALQGGADNSLTITDLSAGSQTATTALGIAQGTAKGTGDAKFNLTVTNTTPVFQVGAQAGQQFPFAFPDVRTTALGIANLNVTTVSGANRALQQVDAAIDRVSSARGTVGSGQNVLDRTVNSLRDAATNVAAANSNITDLDYALELINFARSQIISEAGVTMMAQANLQPQSVLSLLNALKPGS